MFQQFEAVYKNGFLQPLEPLPLVEDQHVRLTMSGFSGAQEPLTETDLEEAELVRPAILDMEIIPTTIEEVRAIFSRGNLSAAEELREEREGRYQ